MDGDVFQVQKAGTFNLLQVHNAFVSVSHFAFKSREWYQITLTWNYDKDEYFLYANGVLIGREDQFRLTRLHRDIMNTSLYVGNPALCYSGINFYDKPLSQAEVYNQFRNEADNFKQELEDELLYTYAGKGRKSFGWEPDAKWQKKLDIRPVHCSIRRFMCGRENLLKAICTWNMSLRYFAGEV